MVFGQHADYNPLCNLDLELFRAAAHSQNTQTSFSLMTYIRVFYHSMWVALLMQVIPFAMLSTLKMLILSPVSFMSPPSYKRGQWKVLRAFVAANLMSHLKRIDLPADTLTSAMSVGMNSMQRVVNFSWTMNTIGTDSVVGSVSAPRWREAWYVYKAINDELLRSLKVSYVGPPAVPYLRT